MVVRVATPNDNKIMSKFYLWQLLAPRRPNWPRNAREILPRFEEDAEHRCAVSKKERKNVKIDNAARRRRA